MYSDKKIKLAIFYLFMLTDGQCTKEELEKFDAICESMNIDGDEKNEVVRFCNRIIFKASSDNSDRVIQELETILQNESVYFDKVWALNRKKVEQAHVVWTLVNLGYADTVYSDSEKKVVSFLTNFWGIDPATVMEMVDTAETILMLVNQKHEAKTSSKPYDVISGKIHEIESNIAQMYADMAVLISEAEIA